MRHIQSISIALGLVVIAASAYFVKQGDTLWDISGEYLNNPFAWPDLWENNRHIQDPHWIYPGDSIYLGEAPDSSKAKKQPTPIPCATSASDSSLPKGVSAPSGCATANQDDHFAKMLGSLSADADKKEKPARPKGVSYYYAQRSEPKIFNGYYQVLSPMLLSPDSLKSDSSWFTVNSGEKRKPLVHIPETELVLGIGMNTSPRATVGAIVEIWDARPATLPETKIRDKEKIAVLRYSGLAKITDVGDTLSRAVLLQNMREIKIEYAKARLQKPFKPINVESYSEVKSASIDSMATVRYALEKNLAIGPYGYVMIDRGKDDHYSLGDGVAIWEKDLSDSLIPPRLLARGIVTSLNDAHSVILVREAYYGDRRIQYGNLVSITHKAKLAP